MAKRSPILGYNHNVRHRGLLFHVQTEDSGVDNPHIYTHLFNGGVIISSRKLQYDRGSAEEVVKALMQAQHKATLKELKAGIFDDKITSYFGDRPDLLDPAPRSRGRDTHESMTPPPHGLAASTPPRPNPPAPPPLTPVGLTGARADPILAARAAQVRDDHDAGVLGEPSQTSRSGDVSNAFRLIKRATTAPPSAEPSPAAQAAAPDVAAQVLAVGKRRGASTGYAHHHTGQLEIMSEIHDQPTGPVARGKGKTPAPGPVAPRPPAGAGRPAGKPHAPAAPPPRSEARPRPATPIPVGPPARAGVVVSRPPVVVGAPPRVATSRERGADPPPVPRGSRRTRDSNRPSLFGKDLISERSLDEVILAYLSEDASEK